jgi:hypothetical protein
MNRRSPPGKPARHALVCVLLLASCLGCASYRLGTQTLYRPDIHSVHVPVFESSSFRRELGERLTEAVVKEIELKTPYKVVSDTSADSILTARVVTDQKRQLAEGRDGWPRDLEASLLLEVAWVDRRGDPIGQAVSVPLLPPQMTVAQSEHFVPVGGQTIVTAQLSAIEHLAEQIVAQMEMPW